MTGGHLRPEVTRVGEAKTGKALMNNTAKNGRIDKAEEENHTVEAKARIRMGHGETTKNNGITKTAESDGTVKARVTTVVSTVIVSRIAMNDDETMGGYRPFISAAVTQAATPIRGTANGQVNNMSLREGWEESTGEVLTNPHRNIKKDHCTKAKNIRKDHCTNTKAQNIRKKEDQKGKYRGRQQPGTHAQKNFEDNDNRRWG